MKSSTEEAEKAPKEPKQAAGSGPKRAAKKAAASGPKRPARKPAKSGPKRAAKKPAKSGPNVVAKGGALILAGLTEVAKFGREMLVIPAQIWMLIAEIAGGIVLRIWLRALRPLLLALWALATVVFRFAERHLTPARGVALVAIAAAIALAASQWADYRSISVGTAAYSGGVEAIAPRPDIAVDRAGEAHSWVMLPLAAAALLTIVVALTGRAKLARLLIAIGAAAIAISILVDAPKGLDEGAAAVTYQGAEAKLLEAFWVQIASGAVLIACGVLLPLYLRAAPARQRKARDADGSASEGSSGERSKQRRRLPRSSARPGGHPKGSQA